MGCVVSEAVMATEKFHLVYDGPGLEHHQMDVRDLAPALLAVGDLVERANDMFNGDRSKVSVKVHASFKTGCFGIDLETAQALWSRVQDMLASQHVVNLTTLCGLLGISAFGTLRGPIQVISWIRGRAITKVEPLENGVVRLYIDSDHIDVEEQVLQLVRDYKIRKALK